VQIDYSQAIHQGEKESKTLADIAMTEQPEETVTFVMELFI
jgi:hypothetical protein